MISVSEKVLNAGYIEVSSRNTNDGIYVDLGKSLCLEAMLFRYMACTKSITMASIVYANAPCLKTTSSPFRI